MFCPECGKPLPDEVVRVCPNCGTAFFVPEDAVRVERETPHIADEAPAPAEEAPYAEEAPHAAPVGRCRRSTAALLLGVGTFVFGMLTLLEKLLAIDLRILYGTAAVTFLFAPLACCFGVAGIVVRARNRNMRGLPSAIIGLLLGLLCGAGASYLLLSRMLGL